MTTATAMVLLQNRFHRDFTNFGGSSVWKYMCTTLRADNADADDGGADGEELFLLIGLRVILKSHAR